MTMVAFPSSTASIVWSDIVRPFPLCILLSLVCACSDAPPPTASSSQPTLASQVSTVPASQNGFGFCSFSKEALSFAGTPLQQTLCLLTPVRRYAQLGEQLTELPPTLAAMMTGVEGVPSVAAVEAYLRAEGVTPDAVGGLLSGPVARTQEGLPARYFVIHDTSTPYFLDEPFPADIDRSERVNTFRYYENRKAAHLFINRRGDVRLYHDFSVPWRATRLEVDVVGLRSRGRFIHIELIQPRRRDPAGGAKNDAIAPSPGFTQAQYLRLSQAYIVASARAGRWMIPTYHSVMDNGISGAHDDPQGFSLSDWDKTLGQVLEGTK
ncbi:hypothetical protein LOS78_16590 [Paracoccus sp. MA]|uniref:hypothetical protein n=1 Tax=Paracoccus sp. MA TaxID=2895796 RepID=UPI001E46C11D|nr:hypothetical protein [Paracoccus sp. MA]UFM65255.1 hypothetical protein LOS78_16590 [Paracoccus sp. MA]